MRRVVPQGQRTSREPRDPSPPGTPMSPTSPPVTRMSGFMHADTLMKSFQGTEVILDFSHSLDLTVFFFKQFTDASHEDASLLSMCSLCVFIQTVHGKAPQTPVAHTLLDLE